MEGVAVGVKVDVTVGARVVASVGAAVIPAFLFNASCITVWKLTEVNPLAYKPDISSCNMVKVYPPRSKS